MTKYVGDGSDATIHFDFNVNGELVVAASATYTLTMNDGTILGSANTVITLEDSATGCDIAVDGSLNEKTLDYEVRYLDVTFVYNGVNYLISDYYVLAADVHFPLSPDDVRAVIGLTPSEVPDQAIDILGAYASVEEDVGLNLSNILTSGTSLLPALIDAVKYKAAMGVMIGVQNSMMQSEQADNTLYKRFASVDLEGMAAQLAAQYAIAIRKLTGVTTPTAPVLSILAGNATDYVTGQ